MLIPDRPRVDPPIDTLLKRADAIGSRLCGCIPIVSGDDDIRIAVFIDVGNDRFSKVVADEFGIGASVRSMPVEPSRM